MLSTTFYFFKKGCKSVAEKYKLMLVDDEPWALTGMEEIIDWEAEGFTVVCRCSSGSEALRQAGLLHPDAVITDIRMPDISGIELIRRLKETPYPPFCVIVSAYSDFEVARQAIRLATVHYLLKPLSVSDVKEAAAMLRAKLEASRRPQYVEQPVMQIDGEHPVFPTVPDKPSGYYLLLTHQSAPMVQKRDAARYWQPFHIGAMNGVVTDHIPDQLPAEIGVSMPMKNLENAVHMIRTATASLEGGFRYAAVPASAKTQLAAADVQLYLAEHMQDDITLAKLANHFYLTETYLCDIFKRQTDETILSFLRKIRMFRAKILLADSKLTLREISIRCGYSDYSYFGRHFKAEVGVTPDLYRKQQRNQ